MPKIQTPTVVPKAPPTSMTSPSLTSTFLRRQWASTPDTLAATSWLAWVPTATAGGTPMKISSGVIRKPPPTPNNPDRKPTTPPMMRTSSPLTDISAMGR